MRPVDLERRARCAAELRARFPKHAGAVLSALDANPSAALPYHGTPHMLVVALATLELAAGEQLSPDETDFVFLAALFHDYDYAGAEDDGVNTGRAAAAVREHLGFTDHARIAALVDASRYPYLVAPRSRSEEVLRDADVAYSTLLIPDAQHFRTGLLIERGAPATEQDAIGFIIGHGLYTATAVRAVNRIISNGRAGDS
ncbi:hypothetical protein Achl_4470 (plasmid) [Pseudarthrobacter chlorophenolicus A6]|uniref:Metal dependent phosphohydrolase n=1 Tax=Pseudarthrobacter chlorophenolicus (strain ATCC 700700 / DSM 12829 / CIP 107037 / JCM 12360 / KCTC 9906 / NCIMB 13794 / A6) TaxID=452863 RepID=B8HJ24_PSECP|nr:hypothetical protein [Pseudarthrobacter chlorophenolicus]ACL42421.1 hypothetical protein Achl_4470 [Pseudarthrobacter chlorophenolicus A6]SDQ17895.1 hypothetical protein SAMN04489738_0527 [Pseudarthrobacter chlorophenolicus]